MEWKRPATAEPWAGGEGQAGRQALQRPALWAVAACRVRGLAFFLVLVAGGRGGGLLGLCAWGRGGRVIA